MNQQNSQAVYQAMLLLDNEEVRSRGFNAARDWVKDTLEKQGIQVKVLRLWGERRLAYSIGQRRRATYLLAWLEASGEAVNAVRRDFYLVGPVFRCLFLRAEAVPAEELAYGIQQLRDEELTIPEDEPEFAEVAAGQETADESGEMEEEAREPQPAGSGGVSRS